MVTRKQLAAECGCSIRSLYNYLHNPIIKEGLMSEGVDVDVGRDFNPMEADAIRRYLGIV